MAQWVIYLFPYTNKLRLISDDVVQDIIIFWVQDDFDDRDDDDGDDEVGIKYV